MKHFAMIVVVFLMTGCQSMPQPSTGMAGVRVRVIAEPKAGLKTPAETVSVYDAGAAPSYGSGAFERVNYSALDEIVVWLEPIGAPARAQAAPITIAVEAQKPAASVAHAVGVGQKIAIENRGPRAANFYSVSDGNEFDLGSIPAGGHGQFTVRSAGLIEVLSPMAKDPVAQVYAAPSRWVNLTRSGRSVDFNDVPPGRYRLASWHPRLPGTEEVLTLSPNQVATASIKVGVNALPKVGPR